MRDHRAPRAAGREHSRRMTPFQRLNLGLGVTTLLVLAAAASASKAQTFDEAVRANLALATDICLRNLTNEAAGLAAYRTAGFTETAGSFGTVFTAPADTAVSEYRGGVCYISTANMGASEAASMLGAMIQDRFPGMMTPSGTNNNECAHFIIRGLVEFAPITMTVGHIGDRLSNPCVQDGTTRITITVVG